MRRVLAYLLVWTLGTAATVGACWLGLRSVLDAAAPQRSVPFSAAELSRASPAPVADTSQALPPADPGGGTPVTTAPANTTSSSAATTPGPTSVPSPTPTAGSSAAVQALSVPSVVSTSGWEQVAGARITTFRRTFTLTGGELTFDCNAFDVDLVRYHANPGYAVVPSRYSLRSLQISLESADRVSRVYVTWRDGPYAEVTETVG